MLMALAGLAILVAGALLACESSSRRGKHLATEIATEDDDALESPREEA